MSLDERFWSKVTKVDGEGCWCWTANKNNKGYGLFRPGGVAPKRLAHRLAYADAYEEIPKGICVLHKCDNPACVRPDHLFLGTMLDNTRDMDAKGRRRVGINPNNKPPTLRGVDHPGSKMTEQMVRRFRAEFAAGKNFNEMARETGIHRATIWCAVVGSAWSHVR
jgi:hypothetical protein